ncbi:ComEC/Rec2 family competence protein [Sagittula stellata]
MRLFRRIAEAMGAQCGWLFPWVPVFLGCGIGLYFQIRWEPPVLMLWLAFLPAALIFFHARAGEVAGPLLAALGLICAGFGLAGMRAHAVAGPVIDFRYYGAIEGRVVDIDRSASDATRLTLDNVVLERMDPNDVPRHVRVSLHGDLQPLKPLPGMTVILTGHLGPPGGAVEPGGFDFRRHAWFQQIGAVGYTRTPVLMLEPPPRGFASGLTVTRARMALSAHVQSVLEGETGAFAAAIMTGDRAGMGADTLQDLRDTNLAHLLAISGLHMGLLAGFVFGTLRLALLLVPRVRHHWPVKKIAATGALVAAAAYLGLSGGNVATERAFIMVAAALTALLLDRRALSLRSVAIAALVVLILQPEALLGPGFQMSFAATTALVAVFERLSAARAGRKWPGWLGPVLSVFVSSAVAGAATAPVGMAHFNQASVYGLLANLVSVPVMGVVVVPLGVVAGLLMPLGLDWIALHVMALGLDWILWVARAVSDWPGSVRPVVAPPPVVLPTIAAGGLVLCLWRGRARLAGLIPVAVAVALWSQTQRPDVLIADNGSLVGIMTPQGRGLSRDQGAGFIADNWLENDGRGGTQDDAARRWPGTHRNRFAQADSTVGQVIHVQGKRAARLLTRCVSDQIVVASVDIAIDGTCRVFDPVTLGATGSVALWSTPGGLRVETASERSGRRLWLGAEPARPGLAILRFRSGQ